MGQTSVCWRLAPFRGVTLRAFDPAERYLRADPISMMNGYHFVSAEFNHSLTEVTT